MVSAISVATGALVLAGTALAQQSGESGAQSQSSSSASNGQGELSEVIVTARRVAENMQRVPVAITALSGAALKQQAVGNVPELAHVVPGFSAQPSFQSNIPVYTIRGQHGDDNPTPNTEPAVGVYFAGMNQARAEGTTGSFFDVESVQVLKGPQGTLFGRNSTGGAILITPMAPQDTFGGYVDARGGNFGDHEFEGVINIPLNSWADLRIGGRTAKRDGYINNVLDGRSDGGEVNEDAGRVSLLLKPDDRLRSTFIGTYYRSDTDGETVKLVSALPQFFIGKLGPAGVPYATYLEQDAAYQASLGAYNVSTSANPFSSDRVASMQNTTTLELDKSMTLKNILGYRRDAQNQLSDFASASLPFFENAIDTNDELFTEELQLQGKTRRLDYLVGVYYLHETVPMLASDQVFGSILSPAAGVPTFFGLPTGLFFPARDAIHDDFSTRSYAAYAHGNYNLSFLTPGLSISGGARVTHDAKYAAIDVFDVSGAVPGTGLAGYTCETTGARYVSENLGACSTPSRISSTEPTYDISLNYQVTPQTLLYLSNSRGYRAGGFDILPATDAAPSFRPEFVEQYELGEKADFRIGAMPARLDTAVYFQDYTDGQRLEARPSVTGGVANVTVNVAEAHIYGGELQLTIKPTLYTELTANYSYTDPVNVKWTDQYTPFGATSPLTLNISNSYFSYVPYNQWSLTGRYTLPAAARHISVSATWYGQSSMAAADNTTSNCGPDGGYLYCYNRGTRVAGYNLLNLHADWQDVAGMGFDLSLFANNVTNRVYDSTVLGLNGAIGITSVVYGPPRMYGIELRVPFGSDAY